METESSVVPNSDHTPLELGWSVLPSNKQTGPQTRRLYGCPPKVKDEAISTWIYRIAARHGWSPFNVCQLIGIKFDPLTLDFSLTKEDIKRIAHTTVVPASLFASRLAHGISTLKPRYRRFLAAYVDKSPRYKFCGQCLQEDEAPYWRLHWRLATTVLCERHDLLLTEFCPSCEEDIYLEGRKHVVMPANHRGSALRYCPMCGEPLDSQLPKPVPYRLAQTLKYFQKLVFEVISHGSTSHPVYRLLSRDEFLEMFIEPESTESDVKYRHPGWYPEMSRQSANSELSMNWRVIVHPRDIGMFQDMLARPFGKWRSS